MTTPRLSYGVRAQSVLLAMFLGCADDPAKSAMAPPSDSGLEAGYDTAEDTGPDADTGPASGDDCDAVQDLMDLHCVGCHGATATDGLDLRDISQSVDQDSRHVALPLVAAHDAAHSYLLHKLDGTHLDVGGDGVQMPPGVSLDPGDLALVTEWIDDGAVCGAPPEVGPADDDPNTLDQEALFACDGAPSSSPGRLRRIDKHQLRKRVGLDWDHVLAGNPLEAPGAARYSTYAGDGSLDVATLDLYLDMLPYVGEPWKGTNVWEREAVASKDSALDCFYKDAEPDDACIELFVQTYLETAVVLGTPDPDEVDRLTAFATDVLADEVATGGTRNDSLVTITSAAWLHSSALFESEVGEDASDTDGRHRLTDDELGTLVAGFLTDRGPGASSIYLYDNDLSGEDRNTDDGQPHLLEVWDAVQDGTIQQPEVIAAIFATRAAGLDPHREDEWIDDGTHSLSQRLDRFFLEWLDVERFASGFQDSPNATTQWDAEDGLYYQRSLDEMRSFEGWNEPTGLMVFTDTIARVVHDDTEVLRTLLTTNTWFLPATTGSTDYSHRLYGVVDPIGTTREEKWTTLPSAERAGILSLPVWLAAHGDAFEDGPSLVHRGKWIREQLFCETVPPLELVTVAAMLPESDGTRSARARIEQTIETLADACVLADMEAAYDDSGGSFVTMLSTLAAHDALTLRTHEEAP